MDGLDGKGLGERVRRVRLARGLTLKQIEAAVGISATHVSEVERGKTSPTIGALGKIARALKVDVAYLLEGEPAIRCHVARPDGRATVAVGDGALTLTSLSSSDTGIELSFFEVTMASGASARPRPREQRGEDIITVLSGRLRVTSGHRSVLLAEGDTAHLKSDGSLLFQNPDPMAARAVWATYPRYVL